MYIKLHDLIQKYSLDIKGIIHVGAHHGEEYDDYKQAGVNDIVLVECSKPALEVLTRRFAGNKDVTIYGWAFGEQNKTGVPLYVETANSGQSNSLLEPLKHLEDFPSIVFTGQELVNIRMMDDFPRLRKGTHNFLNIDTQGSELDVIKGGIQTLGHIDYVYTEINRAEMYKDCAMINEMDDFLSDYGFQRVETFWCDGGNAGNWGDGFYIRKR